MDEIGVGLITAIKEFDYYYFNLIRHDASDETELHFYLMRLGLPKLIAGVLSAIQKFRHPVVTFRSEKALILGALDMVAALGFIEHGRRFGQASLAGECQIKRVSEQQFDIVLPEPVLDMEAHEASVENHYHRIQRQQLDDAINETLGKSDISHHIQSLLTDNVYVFKGHFIGYDAHPDLDDFFFGLANAELQNHSGFDTFNWRANFGGVTVQKYMLATAYFLSLALKHERFALALVEKAPEIRLRDVLTITKDKTELATSLIEALNRWGPSFEGYTPLTPEEAETILKVLSVRRDNLSIASATMAPLPFLIEFSDSAWIASIAGIQVGAVDFLLGSLKYNFPADYDRNQQGREGSMQKALLRVLGEYIPGLRCLQNIKLQMEGKVITDIDFVAIDETEGTVVLFQLKHQDHYGADMKRRSSRSKRLLNEVEHWLLKVRLWLQESDDSHIYKSLGLKKRVKINNVYLVVLCRHFAHFLSSADLRNDAAYATWMQLFDGLNRIHYEKKPTTLSELFATLQEFMTHKTAKNIELDQIENYHLPNLSFRIVPGAASSVSD